MANQYKKQGLVNGVFTNGYQLGEESVKINLGLSHIIKMKKFK